MSKFSEVQKFFKEADLELAEATLDIASGLVKARQDIRRKQVAGAAKARAGKGAGKPAAKPAAKARAERPATSGVEGAVTGAQVAEASA